MSSKEEKGFEPLRVRLERMEKEGVRLFINGALSNPNYIVERCCNDGDTIYMPDYVIDKSGKVKEIRYNKVHTK
ncbi:MAG: hypothetical protein NC400_12040 [Clostridium sp.]|nr:hypothetical protein [Clostridium sp.]